MSLQLEMSMLFKVCFFQWSIFLLIAFKALFWQKTHMTYFVNEQKSRRVNLLLFALARTSIFFLPSDLGAHCSPAFGLEPGLAPFIPASVPAFALQLNYTAGFFGSPVDGRLWNFSASLFAYANSYNTSLLYLYIFYCFCFCGEPWQI